MSLTPEQRRVVESGAARMFVSAAAGSGKTRLLVERYLRAVLVEDVPPARLPTVTFTRKAAGEIRRRIRAALIEHGRADLAWSLDDAPIGTIHSLCSRVLRACTFEADVDPGFSVLDEESAHILEAEAFARAWEDLVLASSMEERVLLARHRSCLDLVRGAYETLRQEGAETPSLSIPARPDVEGARTALLGALEDVRVAVAGRDLAATAAANAEKAAACVGWARRARPTWEDLEAGLEFVPLLTVGAADKPLFARMKDDVLAFRGALGACYLERVVLLAEDLMRRHHAHYLAGKRARGALDFSDLELGARRVLAAGDPPFGAGSRLMVDEYQDTNGLQCDILDRLGVESTLTVGDPYQSIYGFRGADVSEFRRRHADLAAHPGGDALVASLTVNFRSDSPLLLALNRIFGHEAFFGGAFPALAHPTWVGSAPSVESARGDALAPPAGSRAAASPAVSVLVVEPEAGGPAGPEAEAEAVAERVAALVRAGRRPREVVLLLRAFTHVAGFERALRSRGLPVYVVQGRGFFAREEFQDVRALLRLLVNPHDDPALVTVLRSPLVGLPDDAVLMLRADADRVRSAFLWPVMRERCFESTAPEYRAALGSVVRRLADLRARLGTPGLPGLIEDSLTAFDYDLILLRSDGGRTRFANVRKISRLAAEYEALEGPDLAGFLRYLDTRGELSGDREAGASVLSEDDDVVRVMTIHKAKGLEFPVVVVAGLGSAPQASRETRALMVSGERVGVRVSVPSGRSDHRLSFGPHAELAEEAATRASEETVRLYYVAATRAEERLILTGAVKPGCPPAPDAPIAAVLRSLGVSETVSAADGPLRPVDTLDLTVEWVSVGEGVEAEVRDRGDAEPLSPPGPDPRTPVETGGLPPRSHPGESGEEPRRVEAPPFPALTGGSFGIRRASFSSLRRYEECPRAFYLERVLGLDEVLLRSAFAPDSAAGMSPVPTGRGEGEVDAYADGGGALGRVVGTAVHRVLERVDLRSRPSRDEVVRLLLEAERTEEPLTDHVRDRAVRLVLAFWDSPFAAIVREAAAFRERPFRFAHDGVIVTGFMDVVVEREDGSWLVIDHKTNGLEGADPEDAFGPYEFQSRLYALASILAGAARVDVAFLFLEAPSRPVIRTYGPGERPSLEAELSARLAQAASGGYPEGDFDCEACGSASICRSLAGGMV